MNKSHLRDCRQFRFPNNNDSPSVRNCRLILQQRNNNATTTPQNLDFQWDILQKWTFKSLYESTFHLSADPLKSAPTFRRPKMLFSSYENIINRSNSETPPGLYFQPFPQGRPERTLPEVKTFTFAETFIKNEFWRVALDSKTLIFIETFSKTGLSRVAMNSKTFTLGQTFIKNRVSRVAMN